VTNNKRVSKNNIKVVFQSGHGCRLEYHFERMEKSMKRVPASMSEEAVFRDFEHERIFKRDDGSWLVSTTNKDPEAANYLEAVPPGRPIQAFWKAEFEAKENADTNFPSLIKEMHRVFAKSANKATGQETVPLDYSKCTKLKIENLTDGVRQVTAWYPDFWLASRDDLLRLWQRCKVKLAKKESLRVHSSQPTKREGWFPILTEEATKVVSLGRPLKKQPLNQSVVIPAPPGYTDRSEEILGELQAVMPNPFPPKGLVNSALASITGVDQASMQSVAALYKDRTNRLTPNAIRIEVAAGACSVKSSHSTRLLVERDNGKAHAWCEVCRTSKTITLDQTSKPVFELMSFFWGPGAWIKAMNEVYVQTADSRVIQRMVDARHRSVIVYRKEREMLSFLKGNKSVSKKKQKEDEEEDDEEATEQPWELQDICPLWLGTSKRAQCMEVVFDPRLPPGLKDRVYNTYQGFAVKPKAPASGKVEDAAPTIRDHMFNVICGGDETYYAFFLDFMSQLVLNPGEKPGFALVLQAKQGAGKNIAVSLPERFFGAHAIEVTSEIHATGHFNAHMTDIIVAVFNEAVWGGSKQSKSTMKAMITDPTCVIEAKGVDAKMSPNFFHIFICSNEVWCAPIELGNRRFVVLPVSDARCGDTAYFERLMHAMTEREEDREFLWFLLNRESRTMDQLRRAFHTLPQTQKAVDQLLQDRDNAVLKILFEKLSEDGEWTYERQGTALSFPIVQGTMTTCIKKDTVVEAFNRCMPPGRRIDSVADLTKELKKYLPDASLFNPEARDEGARCYRFGPATAILQHLQRNVLKMTANQRVVAPNQLVPNQEVAAAVARPLHQEVVAVAVAQEPEPKRQKHGN
jgi:hypothetical protein